MQALKARVENGHLVLREPTDLPEGTELYLVEASEEDEDRFDVAEAGRVLEAMKASGEKPIPIDELAERLGL
jgi:hypothetical protein